MTDSVESDIAVIGAGPAGSTAATCLADCGWQVRVVERSHFPRFTIGESLLPQCMDLLAQADLLEAAQQAGFQVKRGVRFGRDQRVGRFHFTDAHGTNWDWTWHVQRAEFDDRLAREAIRRGADIGFGETVERVDWTTPNKPSLTVRREDGSVFNLKSRFILDASGPGRVLPKLLALEADASDSGRSALFTHINDGIDSPEFHRDELMISVHPDRSDVWYWLIAFTDGRASLGVVGDSSFIANQGNDADSRLKTLINQEPQLAELLANASYTDPVLSAGQFTVPVERLQGRDFALLGSAGEFVDPIFSSGVTVALRSAIDASDLVDRQLRGETVDWQARYERPLREGLEVFRSYVDAWYDASLQNVLFAAEPPPDVRKRVGSVLAGYVWDHDNPFVAEPRRRLRTLCRVCAA